MHGNPNLKSNRTQNPDPLTKRGGWEAELSVPPSECSPTASGSALIAGVHSAQIHGGVFTVAAPGSTTIHNYNVPWPDLFDVFEILNSRSLPNFRDIQLDILAKATKGTCIWFTEGEIFLFWIEKGKILWGIGIPGAGKTVLASIVIRYLEQLEGTKESTVCVAYVYFRYSEPLTVRDILESLIKQFLERHGDLVSIVEGLYKKHEHERTKPSQEELMKVLQIFIERGKTLFFILDALDEMRTEDRSRLVELLVTLDAKLFITSRPLETLQKQFFECQMFDIAARPSDIDLHIKDFLRHSPDVIALLEGTDLQERIVETIHRKSGGMFLHAKLQLEALHHCISALDVEETLDGFPTDINTIYIKTWERILAQTPKRSTLAKLILLWVTHAHGEMTVDALRRALSTSPETHIFEPNRMVPEALLLSVCCGLISVDEKTRLVRLMHYTTRDAILPLIVELYPVPHAILAHVCIAHLIKCGFQNLGNPECGSRDKTEAEDPEGDFDALLRDDTLLAYAHRSWVHHTRQCQHYTPVVVAVTELILGSLKYPLESDAVWLDFGGPLHAAAFYGLPDLIPPAARLSSPNHLTISYAKSPLILAVQGGNIACAKALLSLPDIDVNLVDRRGLNALMHAARDGRIEFVQLLVDVPGVGINAVDEHGWTALMYAVDEGHTEVVKVLLATPGIDTNAVNKRGRTALTYAVRSSRSDIVKELLDAPGINVNAILTREDRSYAPLQDYWHAWTTLIVAAYGGHTDIVKKLLNVPGIDVNAASPDGRTALSYASSRGHREIVDLLLAFPGTIRPVSPGTVRPVFPDIPARSFPW